MKTDLFNTDRFYIKKYNTLLVVKKRDTKRALQIINKAIAEDCSANEVKNILLQDGIIMRG